VIQLHDRYTSQYSIKSIVLRIICTDKVVCQNMCIMEGNVLVLSYGLVGLKATSMHEARI